MFERSRVLDFRQKLGDAVDERLAAEITSFGMRQGVGCEMFTAPKADFQPQISRMTGKKQRRFDRAGKVDADFWKQRLHQAGLIGAQGLALASSKKPRVATGAARFFRLGASSFASHFMRNAL